MTRFQVLEGLPPYGEPAVSFPITWRAREGLVVEFVTATGEKWVGNFRPGLNGIDGVLDHPNGQDVLVFSGGDAWPVNPQTRAADKVESCVDGIWPVSEPEGVVLSIQGLAFMRLHSQGQLWRTRRLSWDGLRHIVLSASELSGEAWALGEAWLPFVVNLATGQAHGGGYSGPDAGEGERLAGP